MAVDVFLGTPPVSTRKDRILVVRCKNVTKDHGRNSRDSIAKEACPRRVLGLSSTVRSPGGQTRSARLSATPVQSFPVAFLSSAPLWVPHPPSTSARPGSYIYRASFSDRSERARPLMATCSVLRFAIATTASHLRDDLDPTVLCSKP